MGTGLSEDLHSLHSKAGMLDVRKFFDWVHFKNRKVKSVGF